MSRQRVLITAPHAMPAIDRYRRELQSAGFEVVVARAVQRFSEAELLPMVADIDGVICGDDRITGAVIDAAPRLRVIAKWGTGLDSIDADAARRRGIAICNTRGAFSEPVADTVLGYLLLFARQPDRLAADMREGVWHWRPLHSLGERVLGIVGLGDCGQAVARRACAFGMTILACSADPVTAAVVTQLGVRLVTLEALLAESDYVSLHADLRPENRKLIDAKRLGLMKREAVIINTARGELIDELALIEALRGSRIRGAALDVFWDEPLPPENPLRSLSNVYLSPHNANASPRAAERVHQNTIASLISALRAAPIR